MVHRVRVSLERPTDAGALGSAPERRGYFLNAPNLLSLSRILLAGLVWLALSKPFLVLGLMVAAAVTDVLDGWLARRLGREEGAGVWLDPLCDKLFVLSAMAAVWVSRQPPVWLLPLIGAREIFQGLAWIAFHDRVRFDFRSALLGKAATVLQFAAVGAILFGLPSVFPLSLAAGLAGAAASVYYVSRSLGSRRCE
jgi:phosphatidylglycerophosphate synthase